MKTEVNVLPFFARCESRTWDNIGAFLLTAALLLAAAHQCQAVPYHGECFTYRQPDRTVFQVRLFGDEFFAYQETLDGYLVIRDPVSRFFCYATVTADGADIVSTGVRIGQEVPPGLAKKQRLGRGKAFEKSRQRRKMFGVDDQGLLVPTLRNLMFPLSQAIEGSGVAAPPSSYTTGQRVGLVLMASFPDRQGDVTVTRPQVDAYCNDPGYTEFGNAVSVYGYFLIQSNGKLRYNCTVTAYFVAAHDRDYYTAPAISYGTRAKELINEGLDALDAQGFDFTQCNGNGDSVIDGVNCYYAGTTVNSWSEGLWPHKWSSSWSGLAAHGMSTHFQYQITDMTDSLELGTFCHENGHMICDFPDLYSYDGNAARVGKYSLMSNSGSTHPRNVDAYLKINAGWADMIDLDSADHLRCALHVDRDFFYRFLNPGYAMEYFVFEVRSDSGYEGPYGGSVDAVNPTDGLVVYHARETGSNPNSSIFTEDNPFCDYSKPYELLVVEASPTTGVTPWYDDPSPGPGDGFHSGGVDELSDATTPGLKFWSASGRTVASGLHIHSVGASGDSISFVAGTGAPAGAPSIGLTAVALAPATDLGGLPDPHTFGVFNAGGGTLPYSITDDAAWLSLSATSGSAVAECDLIVVSYSTAGLSSGTHGATITVTGAGAGNSPRTLPVVLTVHDAPVIELSTNSLVAATLFEETTGTVFEVRNSGGGRMEYTLAEDLSWLSLDSVDGAVAAESDQIAVSLGEGAAPGVYNGSVQVSATGAGNSPQYVNVALTVAGLGEYTIEIASAYGVPDPAPGTYTNDYGMVLTNSVSTPDEDGGTQYVCTGWAMTGNEPASGSTNVVIMTHTNDAVLTWQWTTNYWLDTAAGAHGEVDEADQWVTGGSNVAITATASNHYHFGGWTGGTNGCAIAGNVITAAMTRARSILASFAIDRHTLGIASGHGMPDGAPGTYTNDYGMVLTNSVNTPDEDGGTQYVCTGWAMTGNEPASGSTNVVIMTHTNDAVLTWQWTTNYWLDTAAGAHGEVDEADQWVTGGSNVAITATASNHYHFGGWTGGTNGCAIAGNVITAAMTRARSILASFAIDRHTLGIASGHGMPDGAPGTYTNDYGMVLTNSVNTPDEDGGTQYVCTGWAMTGNEPASGSTNVVIMTHTNDAVLTWQWTTNLQLDVESGPHGTVTPGDGWYKEDDEVEVVAEPNEDFYFAWWSGPGTDSITSGDANSATVTVTITSPVELRALFVPSSAPGWWLSKGVIEAGAIENDYAAANAGQLKWISWCAYEAMTEHESWDPAGTEEIAVSNMVYGFAETDNYPVVNQGQVKWVAEPFYDWMLHVGIAGGYPWTEGTIADDVDFAPSNIGQLKEVFSFPLD